MGSMNVATLAATDFLRYIGLTLVTILPIVNPVATAALLLGIGAHLGPDELQRQVRKACWYMAGILVVFLLLGTFIMQFFGLSLPGLRIAGGLIISFSGFKMLFPDEGTGNAAARAEAETKADISFTPLAMPSLSGPGSIATVITMSSTIREAGLGGYRASLNLFAVVVGIFLSAWVCYLVLRGSSHLSKVLGVNGVDAVSRIMGFLLICIGVQFGINGITELVAQAPWVHAAGAG